MRKYLATVPILVLFSAVVVRADDIGFIDCHDRPEVTQVLAKAAKTSETVASLPCGERFAVLVNGVVFSRIQTKDGKIGYVYSYLISRDYSRTSLQSPARINSAAPQPASPPPAKDDNTLPAPAAPVPPRQDAGSTASGGQPKPCLIVRQAEGHRFRNSMIAGALTGGVGFTVGAASGGAKYEYVDSFKMSNTKLKYTGNELQKLQQGGVHVVTISKKASGEEIEEARQSCK